MAWSIVTYLKAGELLSAHPRMSAKDLSEKLEVERGVAEYLKKEWTKLRSLKDKESTNNHK